MEERIIEDEGRTIKIKRNALGGIEDATDGALPDGETPEGAHSPEAGVRERGRRRGICRRLPRRRVRRRHGRAHPFAAEKGAGRARARPPRGGRGAGQAHCGRKKALSSLDYAAAEKSFSQALTYDEECVEALLGVWESRTQGFTDDSPFFIEENAEKFARMPKEVRSFILERVGSRLQDARQGILEEMRPLKAAVEEAREAAAARSTPTSGTISCAPPPSASPPCSFSRSSPSFPPSCSARAAAGPSSGWRSRAGLPLSASFSLSSFCAGSSLRFGFLTITKRTRVPKTGGGSPFWRARKTASNSFWKGKRSPPSTKSRKI